MKQLKNTISDNINNIIQKTISDMMFELKRQGLMKDNKTAFQKTEQLLYNYNNFLQVIKDKEKHIEFIQEGGIQKKSASICSFQSGGSFDTKTDNEKADEQIETIQNSIIVTRSYIDIIDDALDKIVNDKYYDIIVMRYFEAETREVIAESFEVDVATISRNKNRLINILKISLFSDEVIKEIFM